MQISDVNLTDALMPPAMILYAYALTIGAGNTERIADALSLQNPPDSAAQAWENYSMSAKEYPPLAELCDEYGLDEFTAFAIHLSFAAILDEAFQNVAEALGGSLSAFFAARIFSGTAREAVNWRARWFSNERTLNLLFSDAEALKLHSPVLRFLLGLSDRRTLPHGMEKMAARVNSVFAWDDLVLPDAQKSLLRHICDRVRFDKIVYGDWGYGSQVPYGRGVRALFSGPPGTGKTMASQVIARDLGKELYKVDVSSLMSKYIGETEKNLSHIFREAADSGGILFFDEADAIIGKRGEQKDSHDKYANMQTGFLLQQIEDYDGVVLLATNFISNIDSAFMRRIQIRVDFSMPDESARAFIWRNLIKSPVPVAEDVDVTFLARNFEITGSEIKNIVLTAAFLAAAEGEGITMRRIIRALAIEFSKTDKILSVEDLKEYFDVLKQCNQ